MTLGETNRNDSFKELIESGDRNKNEMKVLGVLKIRPDITAHGIRDYLKLQGHDMEVGPIHGRLNSLVEDGLVIQSGKNYHESGTARTTYRIREIGEASTQKDMNKNCITMSSLESIQKYLHKLRSQVNKPNAFQKARIISDLKLTLDCYQNSMSLSKDL